MAVELMDLPQEIIELILSHLTHINDLLRAAQVCRKFYQISRRRLKPIGKLIVSRTETGTCPIIECFQNVEIFPFSSLYMSNWSDTRFDRDSAFWTSFGGQIHTATIDCNRVDLPDLIQQLKRYFLNLRSLAVKNPRYDSTPFLNDSLVVWNLPIEELCFDSKMANEQDVICLLRCSPQLRSLFLSIQFNWSFITPLDSQLLLSYFEAIPMVEISTAYDLVSNLVSLPSKIVLTSMSIEDDVPIDVIRHFFSTKRTIKRLYFVYEPTREQFMAILNEISVDQVYFLNGLPNFEGCLDVLAENPGVKNIFLYAYNLNELSGQEDPDIDDLYPFYWSNQKSLDKINVLR